MDTALSFKLYLLLMLPLMMILVGCGKKEDKQKLVIEKKQNYQSPVLNYSDIPVPLGYKVVERDEQDQTQYLSYQGTMQDKDLIVFYQRSMEELGWKMSSLKTEKEGLLLCSKPSRLCTISIRPTNKQNSNYQNIASLHIFIQAKNVDKNKLDLLNCSDINRKSIV